MEEKINRRRFLSGSAAAAGAMTVGTVSAEEQRSRCVDRAWDMEADIVVLGSGLAGCVTAITAHDEDPAASVVVLEKMPQSHAGGNSRVAGQSMFFPEDLENLVVYRQHLDQPNPVPEAVTRAWAEAMVSQHGWIRTMMSEAGYQLVPHRYNREGTAEYPEFPGSSSADGRNVIPIPRMSGVWQAFKIQADRRPIEFLYDTPAHELVQDPESGEVLGVLATREGAEIAVRARRAVVMCTGGFENNQQMHRDYAGMDTVYPLGTPGNTGDGIEMLKKAGAELWHMRNFVITSGMYPVMKVDDYPCGFLRQKPPAHGWIDIAKDNRRFWDETRDWNATHYHLKTHGNWVDAPLPFAQPVHMIMDERTRRSGGLSYGERQAMTWNNVVEYYIWSADNSQEVAKGWIVEAATLAELAAKLDRDPVELQKTVADYNDACARGVDAEFGRDPASLSPLGEGPYYGVRVFPGIICTTGGGRRDQFSRVLNTQGRPIPRLYEAGELGSTMGNLYQNGSFLTECVVSGRAAGRAAVQESPWS
jgi:succinate dehydrogenase/fumarate reductase flavoprotein subunit